MASLTVNEFWHKVANGTIVIGTDTFKMMYLTSAYTPSKNHVFRSDLTSEVAAGGGYVAGGFTVTAALGAVDTTNNRFDATFTPASPVVAAATFTARYAAIYKSRGGAATADELVAIDDFGADITASGGPFTTAAILARSQN